MTRRHEEWSEEETFNLKIGVMTWLLILYICLSRDIPNELRLFVLLAGFTFLIQCAASAHHGHRIRNRL